ncbi:hypothetical protein W97_02330 [Coniosporium apollinis CBS 100218]|uniref:Uncharacterized protein n=1 Tax=Coniosporium apollinis (strain CBS 100218) TaxID=1168221 RepID=R7YMN2_CONA1|nr:uncharacterized protein W97_02330 [Coniosporium apollinis CBS 100218]EON63103.1 hypothetical protein W97_02330 [Coniosporium apollinis CBS 100218]
MLLPPRRFSTTHSARVSLYKPAIIALCLFVALSLLGWHLFAPAASVSLPSPALSKALPRFWSATGGGDLDGVTNYEKPLHFRIVALVFYGRPASVSILDCYLKRNLASNGGLLDEVIFLARTVNTEHLLWLDKLVDTSPSYRRHNLSFAERDYQSAYDVCENGTMYIKIDDDIVFLEDTAIPTIVQTKVLHPEYFVVSANVMNQPSLSWIHHHLGVVKPYMPELEPPPLESGANVSRWRASHLPTWTGPSEFKIGKEYMAPFRGHRWLPMPANSSIDDTPIYTTTYDAFSPGLWHWTIAAQEHYSFFEHLEKNELWRYKFHVWDYNYMRMGIQFFAIWGDDVIRSKPMDRDDEYYLTEAVTKRLKRHAVVDGRALVAHYSFKPQKDGIAATDVLDRYRAYAVENICR